MHFDEIPNRRSRPAYLLRAPYREDQLVRKRTLSNLSSLLHEQIVSIHAILRGEQLAPASTLFEAVASLAHCPLQSLRLALQQLLFSQFIATLSSAERYRCVRWWPHAYCVRKPSSPPRSGGTPLLWHRSSVSSTLTKTICTRRWIGCSRQARSSRNWPRHLERGVSALRSVFKLLRRPLLPAVEAGPQSRRQEGQAP